MHNYGYEDSYGISKVKQMRDTFEGERAVKRNDLATKGHINRMRYLPVTASQAKEWSTKDGDKAYQSYVTRATYLHAISDTVLASLGIMANNAAIVELPTAMEPLRDGFTVDGQSINALEAMTNTEQLIVGRYGLLLDVRDGETLPYTAPYKTETILDYEVDEFDGLKWITLNESAMVYDNKEKKWCKQLQFRLAALDSSGNYYTVVLQYEENRQGLAEWDKSDAWLEWDILNPDPGTNETFVYPNITGSVLGFVPFTFINVTNIQSEQQDPPLLALSNTCLAIYRGSADYRQALFMQGQATPFAKGVSNNEIPKSVGATALWHSSNKATEVDFGFLEVSGSGLGEMRESQENLKQEAQDAGVSLIDSSLKESGEALQIRIDVKTSSLKRIAITGAMGVEQQLQYAATWMGLNPDEVSVEASVEYVNTSTAVAQFVALWGTKQEGAPLSNKAIHAIAKSGGITNFEFDEELAEIETETDMSTAPPAATF